MEKGPFGEFSRAGGAGSKLKDGLKNRFDDQGIPMAGDFDKILPGVGLGVGPKCQDDFIQRVILDPQVGGKWVAGRECLTTELFGDGQGSGATDADDGQGRNPRRG